jgi:hypothetical protein
MKLAGFCFSIVGVLIALIILQIYSLNSYSENYSMDSLKNSVEEMKNMAEFVKNCSFAIALLIVIAGISMLTDNKIETLISNSRTQSQLLVNYSVLHSLIPSIIGTPIKINNLEIAEKDLPGLYSWNDAKACCASLGEGWRLPTKDELNEIYIKKNEITGLKTEKYCCSTEFDKSYAWMQNFKNGDQSYSHIAGNFTVRPVRTV